MSTRYCLVTGANRGLGLEFARQLLARGDRVIATCRHPGKAGALNALAGEHPGRLRVVPLDVAETGRHAALVQASDLETSFRTHALGPFLLVQALFPQLADGATVANISSEIGSIGLRQEFRTPSYAIGKAAQNMATSLLAQALKARGIKTVALHPGWVRTDMGGTSAPLTPHDSVAGLLRVIDGLQAGDSGRFLDWQGQPLPW